MHKTIIVWFSLQRFNKDIKNPFAEHNAKRKCNGNMKLYVSVTFKKFGNLEFRPVANLSTRATFFRPGLYIHSSFNLSTTATSAQRQRPLKHIPNNQNNLSTTTNQRLRDGAY